MTKIKAIKFGQLIAIGELGIVFKNISNNPWKPKWVYMPDMKYVKE